MAELDSDRIANAALAVVDKHGVAGFTMRAVADLLRVTPMALYHYVKNKAALASLVVDAAIRLCPLPPPTGIWREDLWAMAKWIRDRTLAHPQVSLLRREFHVWTPSMLQMTEHWLSVWQQSGLELDKAVLAATTSSMAITGIVHEEMIFKSMQLPDKSQLAWLPNVRLMFDADHNRDAEFELIVRSLIDGMHARLKATRIRTTQVTGARPRRGRNRHR